MLSIYMYESICRCSNDVGTSAEIAMKFAFTCALAVAIRSRVACAMRAEQLRVVLPEESEEAGIRSVFVSVVVGETLELI